MIRNAQNNEEWNTIYIINDKNENTVSNCFKIQISEEQEEDVIDIPTNWKKVSEAQNLQGMEFEEILSFDNNVVLCGELTEADIFDSVLADSDAYQ